MPALGRLFLPRNDNGPVILNHRTFTLNGSKRVFDAQGHAHVILTAFTEQRGFTVALSFPRPSSSRRPIQTRRRRTRQDRASAFRCKLTIGGLSQRCARHAADRDAGEVPPASPAIPLMRHAGHRRRPRHLRLARIPRRLPVWREHRPFDALFEENDLDTLISLILFPH